MPAPSKPKKDRRVELPPEEMETLDVSQSPLRSASHGDVKEDLVQHHARLEKLLLEMLVKIQQTISETVRAEVAQLPRQSSDGFEGSDQKEIGPRSEISIGPNRSYLMVGQGDLHKGVQSLPGVISNENQSAEPPPPTQVRAPSFVSWADEAPDRAETRDSKVKKENIMARPSRLTMRVPWKLEKTKVTGVKEILAQVSRKRSELDSSSESWPAWRRAAKTIVNSVVFEWFCASLILICAVLVGVQAHWDIQYIGVTPPAVFRVLNTGFNLLFTVELVLRLMVEGLLFFSWYNPSIHWNAMDAALVTAALVEEGIMLVAASTESVDLSGLKVLRTLRLARILRIVKVVRFFSELRIMVNGVIGSARSLCWALLLILLVNFLFGVFFMQLSIDYLETKEDQALMKFFGSLPRTMMTLYQGISGGIDWYNAVEVLTPVSPICEYVFSAYVFFTVFCCLNIITGIFVDNAKALKVADLENMHQEARRERKKWISEVAELFSKISESNEGRLTREDFVHHLNHSDRIATCFHKLGINTETTNTDELWQLFDFGESGSIDQDEFAIGIKQFHGQARSIDLYKLRKEMREVSKSVKKIVTSIENGT